jgi:hypothetical protein
VEKFQQVLEIAKQKIWPKEVQKRPQEKLSPSVQNQAKPAKTVAAQPAELKVKAKVISEKQAAIIANHPGDLRLTVNYFIYGGLLLWLLALAGLAAAFLRLLGRQQQPATPESSCWLWGTGLSYTLIAAFALPNAPDARFFLPGLPFLLLPLAEQTVCLPRPKWLISLLASLALLQGGYVLAKTYHLRQVSPALREAMAWLKENPPQPFRVFMYPEGNYRLFPVPHEWYMNYHLREFWRADNNLRLEVLRQFSIGAVVIKKYLVAPVDQDITDLGVYPDYFVRDLRQDGRFKKVFENSAVLVIQVPKVSGSKSLP